MVALATAPKKSTKKVAPAPQPEAASSHVLDAEPAAEPQAVDQDAPIYVRATRIGYYDHSRHYPVGYDHARAGMVFVLQSRDGIRKVGSREEKVHVTAEQQFSSLWMERIDSEEGRASMSAQGRRPMQKTIIKKAAADRSVI